MKRSVVSGFFYTSVIALSVTLGFTARAQTNAVTNGTNSADDVDWARHVVEAYKDDQQQQQQTFKALQQTRADVAAANAVAQKSLQETDARLKLIEESVAAQQARDHTLENLQQSHQQSLIILTGVAAVAFFSLLLFALYLLRVLNRRSELFANAAAIVHAGGTLPALPTGDAQLMTLNPAEQATARFLAAIERLEKRLEEMDVHVRTGDNGHTTEFSHSVTVANGSSDAARRLAVLLGKGQTLLNLGKPEEALACFDEAIAQSPDHADTHVKRGTALEKLERLDEAIESYDRAIQLDDSLTMAYLCKGGVFNRLERYSDALKCYEQALQSQEKSPAA